MHWKSFFNNPYALAAFSAIIGFGFAWLLARIQARREPRKALSWDATVEKAPELAKDRKTQIAVSYNGVPVQELIQIFVRIENTGNTLVRDEYIRFRFPAMSKILDIDFDPTPEQELAVNVVHDANLGPMERRYRIGHLEVGQSVRFRIASDGGGWLGWTDIHPFNEEGGVLFQRRDVARQREDAEELQPFVQSLVWLILLVIVNSTVGSFILIAPVIMLLAIPPGYIVLRKLPAIMRLTKRTFSTPMEIHLNRPQGVLIGNSNQQSNTYRRPGSDVRFEEEDSEPVTGN